MKLEQQYAWAMERLVKHAFAQADFSGDYMADIRSYVDQPEFQYAARQLAQTFIERMYRQNALWWKSYTQRKAESREIYQLLKNELNGPIGQLVRAQVQRNAMLITSTPLDISRILTERIAWHQYGGERAAGIVDELMQLAPGVSRQRIHLIARTELAKASTALVRAQSYELGLDWYVWRTSRDGRVRPAHRKMDGVLISWHDPPDPERLAGDKSYGRYNPGETFNCRCFSEVVLDMKYLDWPMKVYSQGTIRMMSRRAFEAKTA
jgi:SPP1 gp7 family putative phage head morphogenesis protein